MANEITISKESLIDLIRLMNELQDRIESLEIAGDPEVMESLKRSKEQIANGELVDFNDL